jgi:putative membrane protein
MKRILLGWFLQALAIAVSAYLLPQVEISNFWTALMLAVVLGAINMFLKPVLSLLTLPLTIITLGISRLLLNGLLIMLAGAIVPGFVYGNFLSALLFAIVLSIVGSVFQMFGKSKDHKEENNEN